jgi:hypothetical protein
LPAGALAPTTWHFDAPMSAARHSFGLAALPGASHVYAVGGMLDWQQAVAAVERYDACANTWQPVAPLPEPLATSTPPS